MALNAVIRALISGATYSCLKWEHILFFQENKRPLSLNAECKQFGYFNPKSKISSLPHVILPI